MTLQLMTYGLLLGVILCGAAYSLDGALRAMKRPTRWVWVLGMLAVGGAPLLLRFGRQALPGATEGGAIPLELLYDLLARGTLDAPSGSSGAAWVGDFLLIAWPLASSLIVLAMVGTYLRLRRAAGLWRRERVGGEEVLVSDGVGPAVLGVFRPAIVLPPWALSSGNESLEMILLHEREHRVARDPALLALGLVLAATTPWNPALWWMLRRLHLAVEGDCDGRVLALGVPAKAYGDLLLEVASAPRGFPALAPALAEGGQTFLERRLLMIRSRVRKDRLGTAVLGGVTGAALLVLACETPTPPASLEPDAEVVAAPTLKSLSEAEDGYFLVRKTGGDVEYMEEVPPEKLKLIREGSEEAPQGIVIRKAPPASGPVRLKESIANLEPGEVKPLIILDGVILSDQTILSTLDPDEIDSIEVIKGAAAEAMYGARAAGGVIQIQTKK